MSPNWRCGAPAGNRNALKHGRYTAERRAAAREITLVVRRARMHITWAEAFLAQERALKRIFSKTTSAGFRQNAPRRPPILGHQERALAQIRHCRSPLPEPGVVRR
jgi:hypothetical protein